MEYKQPEAKPTIKNPSDSARRAPDDNDLRMNDHDAQRSSPGDPKGQTGRGRLAPQTELPDLMEGADRDQDGDQAVSQRNPGRPGDAPEEKRGSGTRTGGSPQNTNQPSSGKPGMDKTNPAK